MKAFIVSKSDPECIEDDTTVCVVFSEQAARDKCRELNEATGERCHSWDGPFECGPSEPQ